MKYRSFPIFLAFLLMITQSHAQIAPRTLGARAFLCDDGTGSGLSMTWDVNHIEGPLQESYSIHWPSYGPTEDLSFCAVDPAGNMWWATSMPLPPLAPGNIWYGNTLGVATQLPPGPTGSILTIDGFSMPSWTLTIPGPVTISASQITSGTIQPGVSIDVGPGGSIQPAGGTLDANQLSGSGFGKFAGRIPIATGANHLDISYSGISPLSSVTVSVFDPQSMVFGFVDAKVSQITPGTGFRVVFSADYPASGTGELHYLVVNP